MTDRRAETQTIKRALAEAGYQATSVTHGTGTAWSWITVTITGPWTREEFRNDHEDRAYMIVKVATGREHLHDDLMSDYFVENIMLKYRQEPSGRRCACRKRS